MRGVGNWQCGHIVLDRSWLQAAAAVPAALLSLGRDKFDLLCAASGAERTVAFAGAALVVAFRFRRKHKATILH